MPLCHFTGKNMWILKPTSMNRGQGIHVSSSFKKIKKLIREYCRGRDVDQVSASTKSKDVSIANISHIVANAGEHGDLLGQILALNESLNCFGNKDDKK